MNTHAWRIHFGFFVVVVVALVILDTCTPVRSHSLPKSRTDSPIFSILLIVSLFNSLCCKNSIIHLLQLFPLHKIYKLIYIYAHTHNKIFFTLVVLYFRYIVLFYFASFAICSLRPPTKLSRIFLISANINQPGRFIVCVTFISCVPLMWCAVRTHAQLQNLWNFIALSTSPWLCCVCVFFSAARMNSLQSNENEAILCTPCRRNGDNWFY